MPPDIAIELELLAAIYLENGYADKAAEIKSIILQLRARELVAARKAATGGEDTGK